MLRMLLDAFRAKFLQRHGRELTDDEKSKWNDTVDDMTFEDMDDMGVTPEEATFTRRATDATHATPRQSSWADYHAHYEDIAWAVMMHPEQEYKSIYRSVYNREAEEVVTEI